MNRDSRFTIILAVILFLCTFFTILVYFYPPINLNPFSNNGSGVNGTATHVNSANSLAEAAFLGRYGFSTGTNLAGFYNLTNNNEMIINCKYGIVPQFYTIPPLLAMENASVFSLYNMIVSNVGKYTLCSLYNNISGCVAVKDSLYTLTDKYLNYSLAASVFNQTKTYIDGYYASLLSEINPPSSVNSSSIFAPFIYDVNLLNSTNSSESSMINALINLKQMPLEVLETLNGSAITFPFSLSVPFEFPVYSYPLAPACNSTLNIFNMISNISDFKTQTYSGIYNNMAANVQNICVNNSNNMCTMANTNNLNVSFYVQG